MSKCINVAPVKVCFSPTDGSPSVEILEHIIYENGISIGQGYSTLDDTETLLDLNTYLGGGTVGNCTGSYIERLDMVDFIDPTNSVHFTRIIEWVNGVAINTYDIDDSGNTYVTSGVLLSKEKDQEYKSTCYRAILSGAGFTVGDVLEFNVVFDPRTPLSPLYLNWTNRNTLGTVFEQSPSGATGAFPSVGTEVVPCEQYVECKKEIIAVEQKFYQTQGIPVTYTPYRAGDTRANLYGGAYDASNIYLHLIYGVLVGNTTTAWGSNLLDYNGGSNPDGVLANDVATIQAITDKALIDMGLSVGDAYYTLTNDNQSVWFLSPTAVAVLADPTYLHIYTGSVSTRNNYDNKWDVTTTAPYSLLDVAITTYTGECISIQEVKEKDSCTGLETYRYVIEDLAGNLVDASTFIAGWDESNIYSSCPTANIIEIPGGVLVPSTTTFNTFPSNVVSFTVTAQTGSFDISFDSGTTYITGRKGSRTRGQGNSDMIDVSNVSIISNGDIDIIRETI